MKTRLDGRAVYTTAPGRAALCRTIWQTMQVEPSDAGGGEVVRDAAETTAWVSVRM